MLAAKKITALVTALCMSIGICTAAAEEIPIENKVITIEAENYSKTNSPLMVTENAKMSGGKHITMSTDSEPLGKNGYYLAYEFELDEGGGYFFTLDTYPLVTNSYSELRVLVNNTKTYDLYEDANVGITRSGSKLTAIEVPCMSGFKKGKNTVKILIPYTRPRDNKYNFNFDCFTLKKIDWTVEKLEIIGDTAENVVEKGNPVSAKMTYSEKSTEERKLKAVLTDYYDEVVTEETISVSAGAEYSELSLPELDIGWYRLSVYDEEKPVIYTNLCVVKPLSERKQGYSHERFGMDATLGNLGFKDSIEDLCKSLRLAGVQWVRERLVLGAYNETEGNYRFSGNTEYAFTMLQKYGLKVHCMLTGMPTHLMTDEAKGDIITSDLIGLHELCKNLGDDYERLVDSWELQNEPEAVHDLASSETGDKFHNMMKAMSIGFQDSASEALITTAGFTPINSNILDMFFRNEAHKYVDVLTHHGHASYVENVSLQTLPHTQTFNVNDLIERYGVKNMEVWDDEAGVNIKNAEDTKPQKRQAEYTVISTAQALRYAEKFFIYFFKHKGAGASLYDPGNHGPRRAYASYSAMTDILGEADYIGDIGGLSDNEYGYAFENGDERIIILFASEPTELQFPIENAELIDIQGRNKEATYTADGKLAVEVSPEPVYVRVKGELPKELYADATKKDAESLMEELTVAKRVIVAQEYPLDTRGDAKTQGYKISDENTTVTVKVSNLNDTPVSGEVHGEVYNGWELYPRSQKINISPYSEATLKFRLKKTDGVVGNSISAIKFYGEFGGEKTTPCETDIYSPEEIVYKLHRTVSGFTEAEKWSDIENIAGTESTINITSENGAACFKYDFDYNATDLWAYPKFMLDKVIDLSGADGFLLKYEAPDNFRELSIGLGLYVYEQQGGTWLTKSFQWMNKGIGEILIPFEEFKLTSGEDADYQLTPNDIIGFSLGVNSRLAPAPVRDIPEFKILSLGTYTIETEDKGYSEISKVYPEENSIYAQAPENIRVEFSDGIAKLVQNSVYAYVDGVPVECTADENSITAKMPAIEEGKHTIKLSYRLDGTSAFLKEYSFGVDSSHEAFSDLDEAEWAREEIEYLLEKGIVSGRGNGKFEPNLTVSNAEFVTMLVNAFGISKISEKSSFNDIPQDAWYGDWVSSAENVNLLTEVYRERFNADESITRQNMAVLLYRAASFAGCGFENVEQKQFFADKDLFTEISAKPISVLQTSGVLQGDGNKHFNPLNPLTRAEAAVAIYNALNM